MKIGINMLMGTRASLCETVGQTKKQINNSNNIAIHVT